MDSIELVEDRDRWQAFVNVVMNLWLHCQAAYAATVQLARG